MMGAPMLVALKNWQSRLPDGEHLKNRALATVDLARDARTHADCDDVLQQFHAALTGGRLLSNEQKVGWLGPQIRNSIALTAAESRDILGSALNGLRDIKDDF